VRSKVALVVVFPMYDETFFYCSQCPRRVEVSYYDTTAVRLRNLAEKEAKTNEAKKLSDSYFRLVEQNLAPRECGGRFAQDAPRRCLRCFEVLPQSEPGRDVWPPESLDEDFSLDYQSLSFPMESMLKKQNIWQV
jgi:hypothetical protein